MKELILKPQPPYPYKLDIDVFDCPHGDDGEMRKRCTITCEFYKSDIEKLKSQGMDLNAALHYYENDIRSKLGFLISLEFDVKSGLKESLEIIKEKISKYF